MLWSPPPPVANTYHRAETLWRCCSIGVTQWSLSSDRAWIARTRVPIVKDHGCLRVFLRVLNSLCRSCRLHRSQVLLRLWLSCDPSWGKQWDELPLARGENFPALACYKTLRWVIRSRCLKCVRWLTDWLESFLVVLSIEIVVNSFHRRPKIFPSFHVYVEGLLNVELACRDSFACRTTLLRSSTPLSVSILFNKDERLHLQDVNCLDIYRGERQPCMMLTFLYATLREISRTSTIKTLMTVKYNLEKWKSILQILILYTLCISIHLYFSSCFFSLSNWDLISAINIGGLWKPFFLSSEEKFERGCFKNESSR